MKGMKTGGRMKGIPNRITGQLKDMILGALDSAGGKDYLVRQASENPAAFMTLLGKVLPLTISGEGEGALQINMTTTYVRPDA